MWPLIANSKTPSFYLYWGALVMALAGPMHVIFAVGQNYMERWVHTPKEGALRKTLWTLWRIGHVVTRFRPVERFVKVVIPWTGCFILGFVTSEARRDNHWPVYIYRDVVVLSTEVDGDSYTWFMRKEDGDFKAPFCHHDYDVTKIHAAAGFVLDKFAYEDRGDCWSVAKPELGFWWKRDPLTKLAIKENIYARPQ